MVVAKDIQNVLVSLPPPIPISEEFPTFSPFLTCQLVAVPTSGLRQPTSPPMASSTYGVAGVAVSLALLTSVA